MRELEDVLKEAPLAAPSARLDARIAEAFEAAEARGTRWFRLPVPLWACAVAAVVCAALGFMGRAALAPRPPSVVYILPVEGELRRMLTGESESRREEAFEPMHVTVTRVPRKRL